MAGRRRSELRGVGLLGLILGLCVLQGCHWRIAKAEPVRQVLARDLRPFRGRTLAQAPPESSTLSPPSSASRTPPPPAPPPPASLENGVLVIATVRFSGANLTALSEEEAAFVKFQTNYKNQLIAAAQKTGYQGELQVSIDSIRAGSVIVASTTWFLEATTLTQPQAFADTLRDNVEVVFASSSYFLELPSGQITSTNVTVTAASSNGGSPSGAGSSGTPLVVWILVAVAALLVVGMAVAIYIKCKSLPKQDDYTQGMDDLDEDYDPQEAYAQLVAEAQGYERDNPSQPQGSAERVSIPNLPEESLRANKGSQGAARTSRTAGKGRLPRKATSGPVLFTSESQDSGPLPGKGSLNGAPNDTPAGGAPSRMRTLLRSISGPIKVIWPSPARDGRSLSRAVSRTSWSGMLSNRWSGMLAPSRSMSRRYSGPLEPPDGSQRGGGAGGGGVEGVGTEGIGRQWGVSGIFMPPSDGTTVRTPWQRSLSATSLTELPPIRHLSGQLSSDANGASLGSKEAASPLVKNHMDSAVVEPPQLPAMLRSRSHRFLRPSRSFGHLNVLGTSSETRLQSGPPTPTNDGSIQMSQPGSLSRPVDLIGNPDQTIVEQASVSPKPLMAQFDLEGMDPSDQGRSEMPNQLGTSGPLRASNSMSVNSSKRTHVSGPVYFA